MRITYDGKQKYLSTSMEINKRETLASYYVNFKDSGIIRFKRIYHTDFNQWKRTINSFHR